MNSGGFGLGLSQPKRSLSSVEDGGRCGCTTGRVRGLSSQEQVSENLIHGLGVPAQIDQHFADVSVPLQAVLGKLDATVQGGQRGPQFMARVRHERALDCQSLFNWRVCTSRRPPCNEADKHHRHDAQEYRQGDHLAQVDNALLPTATVRGAVGVMRAGSSTNGRGP